MKTIKERANLAAWQIYEEIGLSKHSIDRVAEIIEEKMLEQKAIDDAELSKLKSAWGNEIQVNRRFYIKGYQDAVEKICNWLINYFVFEHEAISAAGCDAFLRKLRKEIEE